MLSGIIIGIAIGLNILGMLVTIGQIGKPRKPITPGVAVASVVIYSLVSIGLFYTTVVP